MHEDDIDAINASSKPGGHMKQKSRKRKRPEIITPENVRLAPEVQELRSNLDKIRLKSWPWVLPLNLARRCTKYFLGAQ